MSIAELSFHQFRNLQSDTIKFHQALNFVTGLNGSGKSSLLESMFFIGHGKSFRTSSPERVIQKDCESFVVSVLTFEQVRLGVKKSIAAQHSQLKINGQKCQRMSDFAQHLALQIITPESFRLFSGGAKERRRFVDLGVFHVKHSFSQTWRQFSKVLKQRNACLKMRAGSNQLHQWDVQFVELSTELDRLREDYIAKLTEQLEKWTALLLPEKSLELAVSYQRGWSSKKALTEVLEENQFREFEKGFSLYGAHKFDIRFKLNGLDVESALSRGQQKLFLLALTFSQTALIEQVKRVKPILLIDDIGAELDDKSRAAFTSAIKELDCQIIITAIEKTALQPIIPDNDNYKMFHVEHGKITEVNL
ncbi:DNA replication/repair protein RecF [Thalassotalea fusca]